MASTGKIPGPYVNDVPSEGSDKMMEYTNLTDMDIGARKSTLSKVNANGLMALDHVGGTAGAAGKEGK